MQSSTNSLLCAHNLTCIREDRLLFEDLCFNACPGDIIQIEGANGTGKTSLLRILAGLSSPFDGEVLYRGKSINEYDEEYKSDLLFLGHLAGVKGEMTSEENLQFYLTMHGLDPKQAEEALSKVNLYGFEDASAAHLSAGQHRRIALARLWQSNSNIWILDEPFTAIDKSGVKNLEQLFLQHADNGGVVILTTHQDLSIPTTRYNKITLEHQLDHISL
ncbi:cytochrome c biogenesis heme-transporting ATPase CcmA [Thalassotalea aquiviva]|uniref:cytochrome c biogenesis heme-transporting ATPase CcmA n=1 Tax=Thalassotalea aquiviva TaxID=3242415 RepID=UPI00352AAF3A